MRVSDFDPFSAETIESPYAFYEALREQAPLVKPKGADCYYLSRYEDIKQIFLYTKEQSDRRGPGRTAVIASSVRWVSERSIAVFSCPASAAARSPSNSSWAVTARSALR